MNAQDLISLESRAARVAATLDARPEIGQLWRRCVGLSESAASLSIEDVSVHEASIASLDLDLGPGAEEDPQALATARRISGALARPENPLDHPAEALRSAIDSARMSSLVDIDTGGRAAWIGQEAPDAWEFAIESFAAIAPEILRRPGSIVGRCLALSHLLCGILPERVPIAERLFLVHCEHAMRNDEFRLDPITRQGRGYGGTRACWVLTPSLALGRGGLRSWAPETPSGRMHLVSRLDHALGIEAGRLGALNAWNQKRRDFAAKWRSGTTASMANLLSTTPVVSSDNVALHCNVTLRTARRLIDAALEEDLLRLITPRRAYRVWAAPALADMISERKTLDTRARRPRGKQVGIDQETDSQASGEKPDLSAALDALDKAMIEADRYLDKYHKRVAARTRADVSGIERID